MTKVDGVEDVYEIASVEATGRETKAHESKAGNDWVVLKLKKSVSSKI